jgi:para-nitrobenzyl esterase
MNLPGRRPGRRQWGNWRRPAAALLRKALQFAVFAYAVCACAVPVQGASGPVVSIVSGRIEGTVESDVERFLGIPFARAPLGPLRWKSPVPPASWGDVRQAKASHVGCVAPESADGPGRDTEDCLYVDVYRPARTRVDARLPVMVFFHGGGNKWGAPDIYDGMRMAREAHAIVIIPAYRLGVFGFLALPRDTAGDTALRDQIAALKWVRSNATLFGGSPDAVTIAGESAGGTDVCALLASPLAKGLFSAAIVQSGFCYGNPDRQSAQAFGLAVAKQAGCTDAPARCLRALPTARVAAAWDAVWASGSLKTPLFPMTPTGTVALPRTPLEAFAAGDRMPVPVLVGYDRDELRSFLWREYPLAPGRFNEIVERAYGVDANSVKSEYPLSAGTDALYTLAAIRSDQMIICPSFLAADALAKHGPVSTFEFADRTAPPFRGLAIRHPDPEGFEQGAGHTSELQYLFGYKAVAGELTASQVALADRMTKLWLAFGRVPSSQEWPDYSSSNRRTTVISLPAAEGIQSRTDAFDLHHCRFWSAHPIVTTALLP